METIRELDSQEISTVKEDTSGKPVVTEKKKRLVEVYDGRNWPVFDLRSKADQSKLDIASKQCLLFIHLDIWFNENLSEADAFSPKVKFSMSITNHYLLVTTFPCHEKLSLESTHLLTETARTNKSCGAVCVSEVETTKQVTRNIITKATAGEEHKKRSSKYTLAVGSSFGHVHAFMKDTDNVLIALDRIGAEDKCLMLIRKPKSASKQMLKAHSWANLSFPEPHLQCLDGTFKGDTLRHQKHKGKRKPFDLNYGSCKGSDVGTSTYSSVSEGLFTVREQKEYPLPQEMNSMSNSGKYGPPEQIQESHSALKSKSDLQIHQNFEVTDKKKNLAKFLSLYSAKKKNIDVLESRNKNRKTENYSLGAYSQTLDKRDVSSVSTRQNDSAERNHNGRIGNDEFYETGFRSEASMPKSQKLDSGFSSSTEKPRVPTANWSETDKPILRKHVSSKSHKSRTMELDKNFNSAIHPNYAKSDKSAVFEENTEGDPVSRSHSLVDLTSGLTFSLVGQKKADSVQHLPTNTTSMDKPNKQRDLIGNVPKNNESSCNNKRFMSLQNLSACINNLDEKQISCAKLDEKRPRRLPEVPCGVDINEKRKQVSDFMKMRMTLSSRASLSPRSISTSNNSSSRQGGLSITPSDREVSALLAADKTQQNNASSALDLCNLNLTDENQAYPLQVTQKHTPLSQSVRSSGSFNSQDHSMSCFSRVPSSGMSESGLTTLTSQSTVDSGYITNDAESDVPSTSNYARSIKQSAQNFYTSNKYFKSAVHHNNKPSADTRTWIEKQVSQPNMENRASNTLPRMASYSRTDNAYSLCTPGAESNAECLVYEKDKISTFRNTQPQVSNLHRKGISNSMSFGLNTTGSDSGFKLSNFQNCPVGSLQNLSKHQPFVSNEHFQKGSEISEADPLSKTWPEGLKFSSNNKQSNYTTRSLRRPSLFQILQIYELCPVRLKLPDNVAVFDLIKLIECEVMLPSPWSENKHSDRTVSSPKGNHATLGGPGSAFKPVKSGNSSLTPITMVTVVQISSKLADYCDEGNIMKGDLIVEINEQLVIGTHLKILEGLLKPCQEELLLTFARDKARKFSPPQGVPSPNEDVKKLEEKISRMELELRKKERTLKQLNALLPWTLSSDGKPADLNEVNDSYISSLSEDEYIV